VLNIAKTCDFPRGLTPGGTLNFQEKVAHIAKVCIDLSGAMAGEEPQLSAEAKGIQSAIQKRHPRPSATDHRAPVEMEEKEPKPKSSIQYILERLSEILLQDEDADTDTSFLSTPTEIDASPEEGARLIRAFIRIKQPELRAAIFKVTTQIAEVQALE
jgi:hypothetical protein